MVRDANGHLSAIGAVAASATATAPIDAAPAAIVENALARPSRPAHDHKEYIQDEQPDGNIVVERCLRKVWPELVRGPEKKGRRQQDGLHQFRQRATMQQLKDHVSAGDHRQRKRGENIVTPSRKQPRTSVLNKQQSDAGQRHHAENQWNHPAGTIGSSMHNSLFSAAGKESIKARPSLPQCESP